MLFNSIDFAIFLPVVFVLYWFVFNKNLRLQNAFIVLVSYVFYGWWDWRFLLLMGFTTICSWLSGILMNKLREKKADKIKPKLLLISGGNILLNLAILGFFKYYNFFINSFAEAFRFFGSEINIQSLKIILPVGISFYTFQALSYSIDVYRKKLEPTNDIVSFFAFVSFFPQLVAGPIERATNLLPQFYKKRIFNYDKAADGMRQILWGLFKKIVIADNCSTFVNQIFDNYQDYSGSTLVLGAVFFAFQIYGDFSGYSDIAIGSGRLFGISLMRNFKYPYFSRDIAEFWRRWHISLSTWFRDYLYIPLGGSRGTKWETLRNTMLMFVVSGFWHGANWTFIVWGVYNALLFLPLVLLNKNRKYTDSVAQDNFLPNLKELFQLSFTFMLVVIGWVFFRAESVTVAFNYLSIIFSSSLFSLPELHGVSSLILCIATLISIEWIQRFKQHGLEIVNFKNLKIRWIIYLCFIFLIFIFGGKSDSFIYFQF